MSDPSPSAVPTEPPYYEATKALFLSPPQFQQKTLLLLVTLAAFVLTSLLSDGSDSFIELAIIVGILLFHESGHYAGMRVFGYTDLKMFFLPFFGAAVSGKARGVEGWKRAVVLLLGPVPGILAGLALGAILRAGGSTAYWPNRLALNLVVINGFNLLPVQPFDGGQLFRVVLFSRSKVLELTSLVLAGLALIGVAVLAKSWVVGFLAYVVFVSLPYTARLLDAARQLVDRHPSISPDPAALTEEESRTLYSLSAGVTATEMPRRRAVAMDAILEHATAEAPRKAASAALIGVWAASALLSVAALVVIPRMQRVPPPTDWKTYTYPRAGFSIELPARPVREQDGEKNGSVFARRGAAFTTISWSTWVSVGPDRADWLARRRDAVIVNSKGTFVGEESPREGEAGSRFSFRYPGGNVAHARLELQNTKEILIIAFGPDDGETQRVLNSFRDLGVATPNAGP